MCNLHPMGAWMSRQLPVSYLTLNTVSPSLIKGLVRVPHVNSVFLFGQPGRQSCIPVNGRWRRDEWQRSCHIQWIIHCFIVFPLPLSLFSFFTMIPMYVICPRICANIHTASLSLSLLPAVLLKSRLVNGYHGDKVGVYGHIVYLILAFARNMISTEPYK